MIPRTIKDNVYAVGVQDWDRRLFDSLVDLPDGTSYNSYLIKGSEKTALIDTVDPPMAASLLDHLDQLNIKKLDYVIASHGEQDHSGSLPQVLAKYPEAKVITNPKCKDLLMKLLHIADEKFITIADKETLSLGDKTLEFIYFPWVHWPETMLTYLKEDKILFPCDLFGSHLATNELYAHDECRVYTLAKRYFAEIMMPFRTVIKNNWPKLEGYQIDIIAPSHGPLHDKPSFIMDTYHSWLFDEPKNLVVIPYVSMHDSTRLMVAHLVEALSQEGVDVEQFDLTVVDLGKMAAALVEASTVVLGTPTVLAGAHPLVAYAALLANALKPKIKYATVIGSYGWGGRAIEQLTSLIPNLKVDLLDPVYIQGLPKDEDYAALEKLAAAITVKHKGD